MKISILTATYNRAHLLPNLYQSLLKNKETFGNFEWLIMDDGSKDETEALAKSWINENKIDIKYFKQKNAGKMIAINNLSNHVTGDIWIEMDSDDTFTDGILKKVSDDFETLEDNVYGILYYKHLEGIEVKKDLSLENKILKLYDMHYKFGYTYDMALVFKTKYRKNFKYELENNERFITEARMYYQMDQKYSGLLIKNDILMNCDYMDDGYSKNILEIFKKYPYGYYEYFKEMLNYPSNKVLFKKRLYMIKHYILFSVLTNKSFRFSLRQLTNIKNKILFTLLYIPGKMMTKKKMG